MVAMTRPKDPILLPGEKVRRRRFGVGTVVAAAMILAMPIAVAILLLWG